MENNKLRNLYMDAKMYSIKYGYAWIINDNNDIYFTGSDEITQSVGCEKIIAEYINGELIK